MPKNLMKVNIFEPYELKNTKIAKSHYNGRIKSAPTKYSFHFDTKLFGGSFYIEWEQIPQYVMEKTTMYRNKLSSEKLYAPSAPELKRKIDELFQAYMNEYSEIKYVKKLGLLLRNNLYKIASGKEELSIGIEYMVFYTKTYYEQNGSIFKEINVKSKDNNSPVVAAEGFNIYDYSTELEDSIVHLQKTMHSGMKEFIAKMGSKENIISHFQSHNILSMKNDEV